MKKLLSKILKLRLYAVTMTMELYNYDDPNWDYIGNPSITSKKDVIGLFLNAYEAYRAIRILKKAWGNKVVFNVEINPDFKLFDSCYGLDKIKSRIMNKIIATPLHNLSLT